MGKTTKIWIGYLLSILSGVLLLGGLKCWMANRSHDRPLEGTRWRLVYLPGLADSVRRIDDDGFAMRLVDGKAGGRCLRSRFTAAYRTERSRLRFEDVESVGDAGPDLWELRFLRMLDSVERYEIKGRELRLYGNERLLAGFRGPLPRNADGAAY